ncbi:MAG: methylenetetrahydrofolate reductase [Acidimicrobiia bacterium]|nr:methylenetetrahydrofolate reductase [Acidimicrobiia bacterium]
MVVGSDRRARRRNRRSIEDLDRDGRVRLRRLLEGSRLVILPTSEIIPLVESRSPPGSAALAVACTDGLGVDQTIAVSEVLASRGYEVTPHLAARQFRSQRHLDETLQRLARRSINRILVVRGRAQPRGPFDTAGGLLEAIGRHAKAPGEVGIAGYPEGLPDVDRHRLAERLLALSSHATFVSTEITASPEGLLRWAAEMRVRGLESPIEVGIPGVVRNPGLTGQARTRRGEWHDPTGFVVQLAAQPALDHLGVSGLRIETANEIEPCAAWRQRTYDLAHQARTV